MENKKDGNLLVAWSGKYGRLGRTEQPNSDIFSSMIITKCGFAFIKEKQ